MTHRFEDKIQSRLHEHALHSLMRTRGVRDATVHRNKLFHSFNSNDYLGLANHPELISTLSKATQNYGVGSGSSHVVNGHTDQHHALEEKICQFTGYERALTFSTGYMANMGVISALIGRGDAIYQDKLNHASLLDGAVLSHARQYRYRHRHTQHLATLLQDSTHNHQLIARIHGAGLLVDDAHALGVIGANGRGSLEYHGLTTSEVPLLVGTFGKAFGTFGAFVAGSAMLIEACLQFARTYLFTTAMPPALANVTIRALELIDEEPERRIQLQHNIHHFRDVATSLGLPVQDSYTAIQPLMIGDNKQAIKLGHLLSDHGFQVGMIRPPTVAPGTARLRITLTAQHRATEIQQLCETLAKHLLHIRSNEHVT